MSTLNGQWLDVFRAGNYGDKGNYPVPLLSQMAAGYDPAKHEVPFVKGHPEHDGPAFGWIKNLRVEGDVLQALPGQMDPAFEAEVRAGRFKKRSVAFKQNEDGTLKMPLELRHIGWLGAMQPAIKGLGDAKFGSEKFKEVEFSEETEMDEAQVRKTVGESITAFFADLVGKKPETGSGVTQAQVDAAAKNAAETVRSEFFAQLETERKAREKAEAEFSEFRKLAGATSATAQAAHLIAGLKERKHWLPAYDHMGVPAMFAALTAGGTAEIVFSDGKAEQKKAPAQLFADILDGLGQIVPEGAVFNAGKVETPAAPRKVEGATVHSGSAAFSEVITARAKEKNISFGEAMKQLQAEGKNSDSFGGATAGEV